MAEYQLQFANIRNVFVIADALAANNTWEVVLQDYEIANYRVNTRTDIKKIPEKVIVLITLSMAAKYRKELKRFMRSSSQKAVLLFDESDAISNPFSSRAKAMLSIFRRCRVKYLTTGTTTRNNIIEIAPQLELLYNNSINYISWAPYIYETDDDGDEQRVSNPYYGEPIPAYREGYKLFSKSHLPHTAASDEINNEVCLINTCGDYTGFEDIPDIVGEWLDMIGTDFTHFPNLSRLWGETRSEYAFTLRYELEHERDSTGHRDYAVVLPYDEQLKLLMEAAEKIAQAIPCAIVRLTEMGAFSDQHELEIAFLYPCEPERVVSGSNILSSQFDYVWDIGREPRLSTNDAPSSSDNFSNEKACETSFA